MSKSEKIEQLRKIIWSVEKEVMYYKQLYLEDGGGIDETEQKQLDELSKSINKLKAKLEAKLLKSEQEDDKEDGEQIRFDFSKQKESPSIVATDDAAQQFIGQSNYSTGGRVLLESVEFLPYKASLSNNNTLLDVKHIDPLDAEPAICYFFIDRGFNFDAVEENNLSLKIEGKDPKTAEERVFLVEDIDVTIFATSGAFFIRLELSWYGDGEKEFPILINGQSDDSKALESYWEGAPETARKIKEETGSKFTEDDSLFLDGDRYGGKLSHNFHAKNRANSGYWAAKKMQRLYLANWNETKPLVKLHSKYQYIHIVVVLCMGMLL